MNYLNLLLCKLHFQFDIQIGGAVLYLLDTGEVIHDDQKQFKCILKTTFFRLQPRDSDQRFESDVGSLGFGCNLECLVPDVSGFGVISQRWKTSAHLS
jgi:hypothetical protein